MPHADARQLSERRTGAQHPRDWWLLLTLGRLCPTKVYGAKYHYLEQFSIELTHSAHLEPDAC
jgi:hypothetical protein